MSIGRGTNNIFDVRTLLKKDLVKRGLRFGLVSLGYCNITLSRGGMCWKIHPLRQFAPRGPRAISMVEGCKLPKGRIFQFIATRGSVLTFFFPDRECIGNYTPNSRVVLPVYNFNIILLYEKKWLISANAHVKTFFMSWVAIWVKMQLWLVNWQ